jgi:uncharacterized protein (TIGR00251 family)
MMTGLPHKKTKEGIQFEVKVEPRSSRKGIAGTLDNALKVKLTAPPVGGEANEQLIEVLAKAAGVSKSAVRIVKGQTSKRKVVEIKGINNI